MKKNIDNDENLLGLYVFSYDSFEADVKYDTTYLTRNTKEYQLLIIPEKEKPIKYLYKPGEGLIKVNSHNGRVEKNSILGELLSLKRGDIKQTSLFLSKYGSLFDNEHTSFNKIKEKDIFNTIDRFRWCVELMQNLCDSKRKNYKMILKLIFLLLFSPKI